MLRELFGFQKKPIVVEQTPNVVEQSSNLHSMFLELFIIGGWFFWLALIILSIVVLASFDSDTKGALVLATIIFCVIFGKGLISLASAASVSYVLSCIGIYVVIGMIWTLAKWWLHVRRISEEIRTKGIGTTGSLGAESFRWRLDPSHNKSRITTWGVYWPWSMIWSLIHDFVDMVYQTLLGAYRKISSSALKELEILEKK